MDIFKFWRYFNHFLDFGGILVIFRLHRYFGHFLGLGGILEIFKFQGYFGHFYVLGNQIGKIVSALELTKERFLICKKHANVLCVCVCVF